MSANKQTHLDTGTENVFAEEIAKFNALAERWWDSQGEMKPLHLLNPVRLQYIRDHTLLLHRQVLDVKE